MSQRPPNIVFIMADQLGAASIGAYGNALNGIDATPTLDHLAQRGTRFERCYATVAVCAPNRATILTGLSPMSHGLTANNLHLDPSVPTYGHTLRQAGYRLGGFGKFHQTSMALPLPDNVNFLGFDESIPTEDPKLGPWLRWISETHPEHSETALATCWPVPYLSADERSRWQRAFDRHLAPRRAASRWPLMYPSPLPAALHQTTWITDLSLDFITRHLAHHPEHPFFCHISYVDPHDPYDPPEPYASLFDPADMPTPLPAQWTAHAPPTLLAKRQFAGFDRIASDLAALRQLQAYYYGSLRFIDDQIARVVALLDARGLWDNTILVFSSDHGELLGDHELITKGTAHYDRGVRCPLIVYGAGIGRHTPQQLVCSLDFAPTFCDWARVAARPPLEGHSFAPACTGHDEHRWAEVTVESDHAPEIHPSVRSVISDDGWRLTLFADGSGYGELFDLGSDPHEQTNLYFDARHTAKKLELLERHAHAYMRPAQVQQYRNLPRVDSRPYRLGPGFTLVDDVPDVLVEGINKP